MLQRYQAADQRSDKTDERLSVVQLDASGRFGGLVGDVSDLLARFAQELERFQDALHVLGREVEVYASVSLDGRFALEDCVAVVVQGHARDGHERRLLHGLQARENFTCSWKFMPAEMTLT